jgi:transcription termination/antitermination protein NusG
MHETTERVPAVSTPHNDATEVAAFDADVEATKQGLEAEQAAQDRETDEAIKADVAAATGEDVPAEGGDVTAEGGDVTAEGDDVAVDETADISAEPEDPVAEMKAALRRAPGDWYVIHSYAGYENKVKANLETRVQNLDVGDYIFQVEVPTEEVTEIKNGQRKQVNRKVLPGYILVRMELNDESWGAVRNTPGVTGFVGATSRPSPLTINEVVKFLMPQQGQKKDAKGTAAQPRARRSRPSRSISRLASRSPSWMAPSRPSRPASARSTPSSRSSRCWSRSSAARLRSNSASRRSPRSSASRTHLQ